MLSGKRPFHGDSQIEVMHSILKTDPSELLQINPKVPAGLERIVRRCLEKDPDHRFQSTRDLAFALESLSSASDSSIAALRPEKQIHPAWMISALLFLTTLGLAALLFRSIGKTVTESLPEVRRLSFLLPEIYNLNSLALSPDGRRVAYVVNAPIGLSKLWLRSLDSTQSEPIPGTEDAFFPFWSPDSRSIGFFTQRELKKLTIGSGPPISLCKVDVPKGGAWNQEGVILFAPTNAGPLYRISATGGEMTPVTTLGLGARFPQFLPDGRHFFYITREGQDNGLYIGSLDSEMKKRISDDPTPVQYVDPGYGLFVPNPFWVSNGKLMARPFDSSHLQFTGEATTIADNVESSWVVGPTFSISKNNVLVYGNGGGWKSQPIWFDQTGKQLYAFGSPGTHAFADMSSDETRLLTVSDGKIWIVDLLNGSFVRFAIADPISDEMNGNIAFSPDRSHVAYVDAHDDLYQRLSSGTGDAERLFHPDREDEDDWVRNLSYSADGRFIIFTRSDPNTKFDLWVVPLFGDRKPFPYLQMEPREDNARFSPDGKWIAYESDETGQPEIYVRSFPAQAGGKWQISTVGAEQPIWRSDGKQLFYLTLDKKLMVTEVKTGQTFEPGASRLLFQTHIEPRVNNTAMASCRQYFVGSAGQRFLINTMIENKAPAEITVLLNWKSLLKKQ
jgi:Tol biopolymer transport system component